MRLMSISNFFTGATPRTAWAKLRFGQAWNVTYNIVYVKRAGWLSHGTQRYIAPQQYKLLILF